MEGVGQEGGQSRPLRAKKKLFPKERLKKLGCILKRCMNLAFFVIFNLLTVMNNFISSDIRPNFLFWARGNPVALLRGLNRPLLTRLIQEELALECKKVDRPQIEIDMASVKVQYTHIRQ